MLRPYTPHPQPLSHARGRPNKFGERGEKRCSGTPSQFIKVHRTAVKRSWEMGRTGVRRDEVRGMQAGADTQVCPYSKMPAVAETLPADARRKKQLKLVD